MKFSLTLFFFLLILSSCVQFNSTSPRNVSLQGLKILGGVPASGADSFSKSSVLLIVAQYIPSNRSLVFLNSCSGSLIAKDIVLTAGHCLKTSAKNGGEADLSGDSVIITVFASQFSIENLDDAISSGFNEASRFRYSFAESVRLEPGYAKANPNGTIPRQKQNDIGLIRLNALAPDGHQPAQILWNETELKPSARVIATGYGPTELDRANNSYTLRKVDLELEEINTIYDQMRLRDHPGHGMISGDSGGGAYIQLNGSNYLWGVNSSSSVMGDGTRANLEIIAHHGDFIRNGAAELQARAIQNWPR